MKIMEANARRSYLASKTLIQALLVGSLAMAFACEGGEGRGDERVRAEPTGHPSDCVLLERRVCETAHDQSPECMAAQVLLPTMSSASCASSLTTFAEMKTKLLHQRKPCTDFAKRVCDAVGSEGDGCRSTREQSTTYLGKYCKELEPKTDAIIADLRDQQAAFEPLNAAAQEQIAGLDAPSSGPTGAKVTVVVFSDFQCPHCARAATVIEKLREKYTRDVRFVFRNFPLDNHDRAKPAARAALAAHRQGKFWEFHDELFANQADLSDAALEQHAKELGLDLRKFRADLAHPEVANNVVGDQVMGALVHVRGTPSLFVNGKRVLDATTLESVAKEIDQALGGS